LPSDALWQLPRNAKSRSFQAGFPVALLRNPASQMGWRIPSKAADEQPCKQEQVEGASRLPKVAPVGKIEG
jgi:hypothetical protein